MASLSEYALKGLRAVPLFCVFMPNPAPAFAAPKAIELLADPKPPGTLVFEADPKRPPPPVVLLLAPKGELVLFAAKGEDVLLEPNNPPPAPPAVLFAEAPNPKPEDAVFVALLVVFA